MHTNGIFVSCALAVAAASSCGGGSADAPEVSSTVDLNAAPNLPVSDAWRNEDRIV